MSSPSPSSLATPTTFTWVLPAFGSYENSRALCSPVFSHEGASLHLIMLPNGYTYRGSSTSKEQVVLYLGLVSEHRHLQLNYEICLLMQNGNPCLTQAGQAYFLDKKRAAYNWQFTISRAYLFNLENELVNDDTLTVRCQVVPSASRFQIQMPPAISKAQSLASKLTINGLSSSLKSLLESGKLADTMVNVSGRQFPAHKALLAARSAVFAAMFEHDTVEATQGAITIEDFDPEVIELLLLYIYTDRTEKLDKYAFELFKAADKYQLESLKKVCESYLEESITTETVSRYLQLAHLHRAEHLQFQCVAYFLENVTQVMGTETWKEVNAANPELAALLLLETGKKPKK